MEKRSYRFGNSYLHLIFGDITTSNAEVLVSSDDYNLSMGGGVSAALHRAAGESLLIDVAKKAPAKLGDVVVTTAGALPAEHIFHVVTIEERPNETHSINIIEKATQKCLLLLSSLGLTSIAFPAIGTGVANYSTDDVAVKMAGVITDFLKSEDNQYNVSIYLYDRFGIKTAIDYIAFFEQFASRIGAPSVSLKENKIAKPDQKEVSERSSTVKKLSELTK
jgi:O-acetyl-ADP-ribose deacetylase (regulator of RNase III)